MIMMMIMIMIIRGDAGGQQRERSLAGDETRHWYSCR